MPWCSPGAIAVIFGSKDKEDKDHGINGAFDVII
jgi:hypothetical protein